VSNPIRCPKCRRTYLQFRCIGSHLVFGHSGATLIVDRIVEFVCSCGHAFVPVPRKDETEGEGEKVAA
jgi:hypothetical protein